ncbi:MAG: trehalose-6-phosphate synthase, partial [Acidobacteria bacterium]|nr:trehalose-6-phosphate synthase [Acidobacteriota bacterium]
RPLVVVSNREPYQHSRTPDGRITWAPTTGGVAVALDALMRERGGVWIAHGSGNADRDVVDAGDRVTVPPDVPGYVLRRIWLSPEQASQYYEGFANEGLWPLCHEAHVRPIFRSPDWAAYQAVNRRFAEVIASELPDRSAPVFIQDYHLALVGAELRHREPGIKTALFWHIPWPSPDRLRICPWRRDLIAGLLGNDLIAFQIDRDRRNFLAAAREALALEVTRNTVRIGNRIVAVKAVPIGVDYDRIQQIARDPAGEAEVARLRHELGLDTPIIGVGVDRLDYTKGVLERLDALELLLERRPDLRDRMTFVQIGVPSRSTLPSYVDVVEAIDRKVADINARHGSGRGTIRYRKSALRIRRLVALYRLASFCVVSSLHDGMNLVAKEFVAAREDEGGVLVLSEMAGAAQQLHDALLINPYDVEGFASALERAIDMPADERRRRMHAMRRVVAGRNVFGWASDILEGLARLNPRSLPPVPGRAPGGVERKSVTRARLPSGVKPP